MAERISLRVATGEFMALAFGRGEPVLLLHGFPDTPEGQAPLAEALAASGHRVIVPWMRGYAPSTLVGPYHVDQLAADAIALADAVSAQSIVGHDWGAIAAYRACTVAPARFRRAVTMAVPHPAAFARSLPREPSQIGRSWYMLFFQLPMVPEWAFAQENFALVERLWRAWSPGLVPPADVLRAVKRCLAESMPAPIAYYRALRPLRWDRIAVPTLHLHGADDGCVGVRLGRGQERFFTGPFRSEVIAGAGHFLGLERPDELAAKIAAWLTAG